MPAGSSQLHLGYDQSKGSDLQQPGSQTAALMQVAAVMRSGCLKVWQCSMDEQSRLQGLLVHTVNHQGKGSAVIAAHFVSATQRASQYVLHCNALTLCAAMNVGQQRLHAAWTCSAL